MSRPSVIAQARLVAWLDLTRRLRDRSVLIQVFLAPVVLALIVGGAFGGGTGGIRADVWLADADRSEHSSAIVAAMASGAEEGGVRFIARPGVDLAAARNAVDDESADAVVVIPAGFGAAVESGAAARVVVVSDAGDELVAGIATSVAQSMAHEAQLHRFVTAVTMTAAAQLGVAVQPEAVAAAGEATPEAITVRDNRFENDYSLMAFFAPGMAMIFLFFVMGAAARSVLTERREGTLARMLAGGASPTGILVGKSAAVLALGLAGLLTVWAITSIGFAVDWGDPLGVLLIIVSVAVAVAGISLVIAGLAKDEAQSEALTVVVTLVLAVLGGSFIYATGGFLAQVRPFTPNGQALTAFTELAAGGATASDVLPAALILWAIGVTTAALGMAGIRRGFVR
jgi:ABC-2 type transport system permease protein